MEIGLDSGGITDLKTYVEECKIQRFDFVTLPLFKCTSLNQSDSDDIDSLLTWEGSDLVFAYNDWSTFIEVELTSWFFDYPIDEIDINSKLAIMTKELDYACHLGVRYISIKINENTDIGCISQILLEFSSRSKLKAGIFLVAEDSSTSSDENYDLFLNSMLDKFEKITILTKNIPNLSFSFVLTNTSIKLMTLQRLCGIRWLSVTLKIDNFFPNNKGIPILPKNMRSVLMSLLKKYLSMVTFDPFEHYENVPQIPLQPLAKNLESFVYEVFESDPIKYQQYEKAISYFFDDNARKEKNLINILLIGAGRGPLFDSILRAAEARNVSIHVVAIEKNLNAMPTLKAKFKAYKEDLVELVHADIRNWERPGYVADLIVSELLGSFGDNELSPECLESARKYTNDDSVFIPSSSTSYICPVSAPILHHQISTLNGFFSSDACQSPYVAYLFTSLRLSNQATCFTFDHKNSGCRSTFSGNRHKKLNFSVNIPGILHGFAGYFTCNLYKDVTLSINPPYETPKMFSWLPFFFPIENPFLVNKGDNIHMSIWRKAIPSYIWYEWCIESPSTTFIHNSAGKHHRIYLN